MERLTQLEANAFTNYSYINKSHFKIQNLKIIKDADEKVNIS